MTVVKNLKPVKTEKFAAELLPIQILELKSLVDEIPKFNRTLPETLTYWLNKNKKNLTAAYEKASGADKAVEKEYVKFDDEGRMVVWNLVEGDGAIFGFMQDNESGRSLLDKEGNKLPKGNYFPYVEDVVKREEYNAKKAELNKQVLAVNLIKVARYLLEKVEIPTSVGNYHVDMTVFYDNIVIDDDKDEEE